MKKTKVVLFASHFPGVKTAAHLKECEDEILRLYLPDRKEKYASDIIEASGVPESKIFYWGDVDDKEVLAAELRALKPEYFVLVYWPYLLKGGMTAIPLVGSVNFHPALLPINRGWYPHVHSIIDGSPLGVTLHDIDEGIDTGKVWVQKEVDLKSTDTAKSIYDRLQNEIIALFEENWNDIKSGRKKSTPQNESRATYHSKKDIDGLDKLDLDKTYSGRDLINLLRARSFGELGFAYFEEDGKRIHMNLRLSEGVRMST